MSDSKVKWVPLDHADPVDQTCQQHPMKGKNENKADQTAIITLLKVYTDISVVARLQGEVH